MIRNAPKQKLPIDNFIPFAPPDIGNEEIDSVVACLQSGWLTAGNKVKEFEQHFANFVGHGTEAVAVNSATSGLLLALEAIGIGPGDEVITTCYTFSSTAMNILHLGGTPVLVDIDPATMNINPKHIEAAITPRTKAIIPVHFAGLACDMDAIISIAKKHHLRIIEDAAHALPTRYNGQLIGSLDTDATVYSFYATKTMTTGEGGMIVTRDAKIAKRCQIMRQNGISKDVFDRYTSTKPKWHYDIVAQGFKCNMNDIAASIGIPQLKKANEFATKRAAIAKKYRQAFADLPIILPADIMTNHDSHAWHLFVIRLKEEAPVSRDEFIQIMSEQYHIGCSVHFVPLHHHSFWQRTLSLDHSSFIEATNAYEGAISLPLFTKMNDTDIARVIEAVLSILKG